MQIRTVKHNFFKCMLAFMLVASMLMSMWAISGLSFTAFASTQTSGQTIYFNLSQNESWSTLSSIKVTFFDDNGNMVGSSSTAAVSNGVASVTAPTGATRAQLSSTSGVGSVLGGVSTAPASGYIRIFFDAEDVMSMDQNKENNETKTYDTPYVYYWKSSSSESATWPGMLMTKISGNYYYADVSENYDTVIFNNGYVNNFTSHQTIVDGGHEISLAYSSSCAYFDGSDLHWKNPMVTMIEFSGDLELYDRETEYYIQSDNSIVRSKYISTNGASQNTSYITYKTVYVYNTNWDSLDKDKIYATFDYTSGEPFSAEITLTKTTVDGKTVFTGKIPEGAVIKFHPNSGSTLGSSSQTTYPSDEGYGTGDDTATYKISGSKQSWCKFSDIESSSVYNAVLESKLGDAISSKGTIVAVDATYFDYLSDKELTGGYLNCMTSDESSDTESWWYQFDNFNGLISDYASNYSESWLYPLYFGNMYYRAADGNKESAGAWRDVLNNHANNLGSVSDYTYSSTITSLTNFNADTSGLENILKYHYEYAVNNSNGMEYGGGSYNQSLMGLVYNELNSSGNIQAADGVELPYFSTSLLSGTNYAKIYKGYFPFVATTDESTGVTTYKFNSKEATDNVYFTWDGSTPKYVNYGEGDAYGVKDALSKFGGDTDGYGIFPFNNTESTMSYSTGETKTYTPASDELWIESDNSYEYFCLWAWTSENKGYWVTPSKTINGSNGKYYYIFTSDQLSSYTGGFIISKWENLSNDNGQTSGALSGNLSAPSNYYGKIISTSGSNSSTTSVTAEETYSRSNQSKGLDYGFGIRLDIDFKVPENGTLDGSEDGDPVTFSFTGDDDLWVFIGKEEDGSDGQLVLDLGGDHKEAEGSINFKDMTATAEDVFAKYSTSNSTSSSVSSTSTFTVTDTTGSGYIYGWYGSNQTTLFGSWNDNKKISEAGTLVDGTTNTYEITINVPADTSFSLILHNDSQQTADITNLYDGAEITYSGGTSYSVESYGTNKGSKATNLGKVITTFNNGDNLDAGTTYHMTVFYMERGESESNFSVEFTMTPASNDLIVNKELDTGSVVSAIAQDLEENEVFDYTISDGTGSASSGLRYKLNGVTKQLAVDSDDSSGGSSSDDDAESDETLSFTITDELGNGSSYLYAYLGNGTPLYEAWPGTQINKIDGATYDSSTGKWTIPLPSSVDSSTYFTIVLSTDGTSDTQSENIDGLMAGADITYSSSETYSTGNRAGHFKPIVNDEGDGSSSSSSSGSSSGSSGTTTTGTNWEFSLQDEDSAEFDSIFETGSSMTVNETVNNNSIGYTTSWQYYDRKTGKVIRTSDSTSNSSDTSTKANFTLVDPKDSTSDAELGLDYVNTIQTSNLSLTKKVVDEDGTSEYTTSQPFEFTVLLDLDGDGTTYSPKAYPIEYTITNSDGTSDGTKYIAYNGKFTVQQNQTVTLLNLPLNSVYSITESSYSNYSQYSVSPAGALSGTVGESNDTIIVTNIPDVNTTSLSISKTLDGENYTGSDFTYSIHGLTSVEIDSSNSTVATDSESKTVSSASDGTVTFTGESTGGKKFLAYVDSGHYRYVITESLSSSLTEVQQNGYIMDGGIILVDVEYDSESKTSTPTYYKVSSSALGSVDVSSSDGSLFSDFFTDAYKVTDTASFANTTQKAALTVVKKDENDEAIEGAKFALVKISSSAVDNMTYDTLVTIVENNLSDTTGVVQTGTSAVDSTTLKAQTVFDNLLIYENGSAQYNSDGEKLSSSDDYISGTLTTQHYALIEYSAPAGYNINKAITYVSFPIEGQYTETAEYIDYALGVPSADGTGAGGFMIAGIAVISAAVLFGAAYLLYDKAQRKKRLERVGAKNKTE